MATGRLPDPNSSPLTAKGDLYTYSTVPAKLAVGNNGETLVADSSATTGLRWSPAPSTGNPVINSAFQIWQRGTSITPGGGAYGADRWKVYDGSGVIVVTRQATGDTTNLPNIQYCARLSRPNGNTNTTIRYIYQPFESINSIPFAGKTVTFSFYARAGANFSPTSGNITYSVLTGTGTDQDPWVAGYTGSATPLTGTAALTSTWQRFTGSATLSTSLTELTLNFNWTPTGTAGAADYFEITGVQLDLGSVALPFRTQNSTLQGELAACQRYFEQINGTSGRNLISGGYVQTTSVARFTIPCVQKRTTPTVTTTGTINVMYSTGSEVGISSYTELDSNSSGNFMTFRVNTSSASLTAGNACALYNNTASTFAISAEL